MELLAPAGDRAALEKAIAAGADAVYLGCSAFSARANAGNFNKEELAEAVRFAHLYHVRVHVTVNTLIKDSELQQVYELLSFLDSIRVDAVLIQDLGVLQMALECFPSLPVHASTQMALHNAAGARWAAGLGIKNVVLARECSLPEIALASKENVPIETFGHGAQCVAVSGECLFSSMVGGRSGNRGRCAQPCRMQYTWKGKKAAWLSPRDVCVRDDLPEFFKAGVTTLKIEGRLKRPEYVAVVANSYRKAIDACEENAFQSADDAEREELLQIFQRGNLMRGYAKGTEDADVICLDRVNHGGVRIGTVEAVAGGMARIRTERDLCDGDGLQLRGDDGDRETIYSGRFAPDGTVAVLRIRPGMKCKAGDEVYRLTSSAQIDKASKIELPKIKINMQLYAMPGTEIMLTVDDGNSFVTVNGDIVSEAKNRAVTAEDARRSMEKLGDTPFELNDFSAVTEGAFVPVSVLNALRRSAVEKLANERICDFEHETKPHNNLKEINIKNKPKSKCIVVFRNRNQYEIIQNCEAKLVWYPEDFRLEALENEIKQFQTGIWFRLPTVCEQATLDMLYEFVERHRDIIAGVMLGSVGQLGMVWKVPFGASGDIPVMNRRAAAFLFGQGCEFVTASQELDKDELESLTKECGAIIVPTYGRTQLMILHHCPARTALGLTSGHKNCSMCDTHHKDALENTCLTDRMGFEFPLLRQRLPEGCLVRLMNALPTDLRQQTKHWPGLIELSDEDDEMIQSIVQNKALTVKTTSGHWKRPVE